MVLSIDIFSTTVLILSILSVIAIGVVQFTGNKGHESEQTDREFFDEHGRWPDEPESAARKRPGGYGSVDDLPGRRD